MHENARRHSAAVTAGTLEEIYWHVLPHPACSSELASSDFHLFGPLIIEALRGKILRADDVVKLLVQWWVDELQQTLFERAIMKVPEQWRRCIALQGEYVEK
jgi:histone-lysine N-methyltransferase SETMAR